MSFFDSLLYSFSNIFSIGPDLYDDEGDECCGGAGPGGTCCKNLSPSIQQQKDYVIMTTPPLTPPTCQQQQEQQQQQDLYTCRCSDGDHAASDDDARTATINLVVCGQQLHRQTSLQTITASSPSSNILARVEHCLQKSTEFKTRTVALDRQCQDLLFSLPQCVFVLSGTSKDHRPLNRLLDWMNEQIMMTPRHPPLHHLAYGIICLGNHELALLFQQKLDQLGATEIQPIYNVHQQQRDDDMEEKVQQWVSAFSGGLRQQREQTRSTKQQHHHHPTSAGCTSGMVDVEDMGQVAQKINLMNKKKLVKQHPRARPKRIIGLDPTTSRQKALPTTQVTTYATTSSIDI